jgi:pimeloyl-ACP methyl ester carboxylesterase
VSAARRARTAATILLDRLDTWRHRDDPRDGELLGEPAPRPVTAEDRLRLAFDRELVLRACGRTTRVEGRSYPYVVMPGRGDTLCIHYSAFFGEWGERRQTRAQFAGWFHRLRMFWPLAEHNFLFLCDTFGADSNGTYYKGVDGDFFVERAMETIQADVAAQLGVQPGRVVTAGSSMGATAALRFALRHGYAGAVAVSPHIDLDISALRQGRLRHVAAIFGREDVEAPELEPVTREVARLAASVRPLPRLVLQSTLDDEGVHEEQVLPLASTWKAGGGEVRTDFRATGGHTSEYATPDFFTDAIEWCLGASIGGVPVAKRPNRSA